LDGRVRTGRAARLTRIALPVALVVGALTMSSVPGSAAGRPRAVADVHHAPKRELMLPFAAKARSFPLVVRTVVKRRVVASTPPAAVPGVPIVALPVDQQTAAAAIPPRVLAAYVNAAHLTDSAEAQCQVSWQMLAGIGLIESDNARSGGSANPGWDGVANPPIFGPVLDGRDHTARVPDTDQGRYDGDHRWDRAVGPMQIMPATWAVFAADGNHDGIRNPQDIDDAALAASDYLCTASRQLNEPRHLIRALYAYNHSFTYVRAVLAAIAGYLQIDPAKLGINGLPKHHRRPLIPMGIVPPTPPAASGGTPPPKNPKPAQPWSLPTPTKTLPVKLPHHHQH